ncbi:MAG: sulfatase-like hydrolase/transferase, partial [Phycisphaerae bacterium]|nr:sulfatase-like hydrolase/transferase [Phycisphaerae bacterium]
AALGVQGLASAESNRASDKRPNILLIYVDDVGHGDVSAGGCRSYATPNIDSIATEGIRFSSGYVAAPACGPSRAALMTGRYMGRFGYDDNRCITDGVPKAETFMSDMLKAAGYATGHIGKWHLGSRDRQHPTDRGFDESYQFSGKDLRPRPDWYAAKAVAFIDKHKDHPFFLYLAPLEVHTKLAATAERLARVAHIKDKWQRLFAAMMLALDDTVGKVLAKLRKERLDEQTIVFFISDNGASLRNPVWIYDGATVDQEWIYKEGSPRLLPSCRSNAPLSGGKGILKEGGIRVPYFVRWAGRLPAGKVCDDPVVAMDVFATAAAVAGVKPPEGRRMDGVDLVPYLTGKKDGPPHEYLFWKKQTGRNWWKVARKGKWKLSDRCGGVALYDLRSDVAEKRNVAAKHPDLVRQMRSSLNAWFKEVTAECDATGFKYLTMEQWQRTKGPKARTRPKTGGWK